MRHWLTLFALWLALGSPASAAPLSVGRVEFATAADCMGPLPLVWRPKSLPGTWQDSALDTVPNAMFRFPVIADGRSPIVVTAEFSTLWQSLVVNGRIVETNGDPGKPPPGPAQRWQQFVVPPTALVAGPNVIELHQINYPATPRHMGRVWVGEATGGESLTLRALPIAWPLLLLSLPFVLLAQVQRSAFSWPREVGVPSALAMIALLASGALAIIPMPRTAQVHWVTGQSLLHSVAALAVSLVWLQLASIRWLRALAWLSGVLLTFVLSAYAVVAAVGIHLWTFAQAAITLGNVSVLGLMAALAFVAARAAVMPARRHAGLCLVLLVGATVIAVQWPQALVRLGLDQPLHMAPWLALLVWLATVRSRDLGQWRSSGTFTKN